MIALLQKYLQINTSHPNPDYENALTLFIDQAQADGFAHKRIDLPSGLPVLMITFQGSDTSLPAIALNHHMDVVPANQTTWKHNPFGGIVEDGIIYGRGTQDMKGIGVVHYQALKTLKNAGFKPKRTIHLIIVPHEEVGGFQGVGQLIHTPTFKKLNIGFVLDEALASGDTKKLLVKVSERKPVQIHIHATGDMVHGSRLHCVNATHKLSLFLADIAHFQKTQQEIPATPAGLLLSMNVTSLAAGIINNGVVALNVIPEDATATIDMRVPPTMNTNEAKLIFDNIIKKYPQLSYEVLCQAEEILYNPDYQSDFYQALTSAIQQHNLTAQPYFAEEASDMRFYLTQGITGLGLTPFTSQENIHRIDECVSIKDLKLGCDIFITFLRKFCE